jgi:hypothetical protein
MYEEGQQVNLVHCHRNSSSPSAQSGHVLAFANYGSCLFGLSSKIPCDRNCLCLAYGAQSKTVTAILIANASIVGRLWNTRNAQGIANVVIYPSVTNESPFATRLHSSGQTSARLVQIDTVMSSETVLRQQCRGFEYSGTYCLEKPFCPTKTICPNRRDKQVIRMQASLVWRL